jgi:hypothetical protein
MKGLLSLDPWLFRYWFAARGDDWYAKLFQGAQERGLTAGEITPAYAILDEEILRRMQRVNSKVKLIFVMRDPVERAWSAVNNAVKKGVAETPSVEDTIERARNPGSAARSAYADTIKRFERIFPREQIYYCFFDELRDRPEALTASLLSFLGVDPALTSCIELPSAVNVAAGSKPIPIEFSRELAGDYLPLVTELCQRFDGPPRGWKARYETLVNGGG